MGARCPQSPFSTVSRASVLTRARRFLLLEMQIPNNFGLSRGHRATTKIRVCVGGKEPAPESGYIHLPGAGCSLGDEFKVYWILLT